MQAASPAVVRLVTGPMCHIVVGRRRGRPGESGEGGPGAQGRGKWSPVTQYTHNTGNAPFFVFFSPTSSFVLFVLPFRPPSFFRTAS